MKLTIVTPEKEFLNKVEVIEVQVPGQKGELGILPGHAPLISPLGSGVLRYKTSHGSDFEELAVSWGYCEVRAEDVIVLAESFETKKSLDKKEAKKVLANTLKQLENISLSPKEIRELRKKQKEQESLLQILS